MDSLQTIEIINQVIANISSNTTALLNSLSECDLQQQDILHYIENKKLNAVQTTKIMKMLRELRIKRRNIKNELARYQAIICKFNNGQNLLAKGISLKDESTWYEFRTNILQEYGWTQGSKMYFGEVPEVTTNTTPNISTQQATTTCIEMEEDKDGRIAEALNSEGIEADGNALEIAAIMDHPEGKRIIMTNVQSGEVSETKNFEKAVLKALGGRATGLKPSEFVKNVSGAMKAIKFGNEYLGFRWEVK